MKKMTTEKKFIQTASLIIFTLLLMTGRVAAQPAVFADSCKDIIKTQLHKEAAMAASAQRIPDNRDDWERYRLQLKQQIMEKAGVTVDHQLPLDLRELKSRDMIGYTVKNIIFQTRPGIYATAALYMPKGSGPFPAAVVMMGHSRNGRMSEKYQQVGHTLAMNGYVSINIDPWGTGERASVYGDFEYHGANLGASLMNVGETLLGMQVADNMRAIDLLCSLPCVDANRIGATGSSGGGNQTMWLTILDDRVQASVPVVSVGTFESYVMCHNCICELLPDGLSLTEEAGALGLVAPRALRLCNAFLEENKAFLPSEMFRTYKNLRPVYGLYDADEKLSYFIADITHGYWPEFREAMLGWFDLHLKGIGTGAPKKEKIVPPFFPEDEQMSFAPGQRDPLVVTTAAYCRTKGKNLRAAMLAVKKFDVEATKNELARILKLAADPGIVKVNRLPALQNWERAAIETSFGTVIPVLYRAPTGKDKKYVIACSISGKAGINPSLYDEARLQGAGIMLIDLWGTGEGTSRQPIPYIVNSEHVNIAAQSQFHTLSRAALWLGKRVMGIWVNELEMAIRYLTEVCEASEIQVIADRETGVAALFMATRNNAVTHLELTDSPVSYLFDERVGIDFFTMAAHIPNILKWGDISLAAGLSGKHITFVNPVTMSGRPLSASEKDAFAKEYANMRKACGQKGSLTFKSKTIRLFNGKNLDGWYTYLKDRGRDSDPNKVFTVRNGLLRISGEEWGCITTNEEYENYVIEIEYKTGTRMFEPRLGRAFDSGLLIHSTGEDGMYAQAWMYSIEANIIDGGCGDFIIVVPGNNDAGYSITTTAKQVPGVVGLDYDPNADTVTVTDTANKRINRIGRDHAWEDVANFRDKTGVEKPPGEWNIMKCVAQKDTITIYLNGQLVNRAWNVTPSKGRIQIQSEGAEYFFKRIDLTLL